MLRAQETAFSKNSCRFGSLQPGRLWERKNSLLAQEKEFTVGSGCSEGVGVGMTLVEGQGQMRREEENVTLGERER